MCIGLSLSLGDAQRLCDRARYKQLIGLMMAFDSGHQVLPCGAPADSSKLCTRTFVMKGPRTRYCRRTGRCIYEFDHFCNVVKYFFEEKGAELNSLHMQNIVHFERIEIFELLQIFLDILDLLYRQNYSCSNSP